MQPREELDHYEGRPTESSGGSLEEQLTNREAISKEGAWEVSVGNEDMVGNWIRGYSWSVLATFSIYHKVRVRLHSEDRDTLT